MNKKSEKILLTSIIITVFIIVALIVIMLIIIKNNKKENIFTGESYVTTDDSGDNVEESYTKEINSTISREALDNICSCMQTYLDNINVEKSSFYRTEPNGKKTKIIEDKDINQLIYDILSENYKTAHEITLDNLQEKTRTIKEKAIFVPVEASVIQDNKIKSFLVHGLAENLEYNVIGEIYSIVNIELSRNVFSVEPLSGKYNSIKDIKIEKIDTTINKTENNTFTFSNKNYESISKEYLDLYKRLAIGSPSKMYNLLDKDYREKRFGSEDSFKKYVENNKDRIYGLRLEQYDASEKEGYTQYICIDQYENTYIFREKSVLDYSVLLDTYTVDIPEFTEKYDRANDSQKVVLNIQKVLTAINNRDYSYVFSKLDSTYKANNFKQNSDFKNYIDKNYFIANTAEYGSCKQEGNVYICTFKIKDSTGKNTNTQERKIAMQLLNNRDFVMSFIFE